MYPHGYLNVKKQDYSEIDELKANNIDTDTITTNDLNSITIESTDIESTNIESQNLDIFHGDINLLNNEQLINSDQITCETLNVYENGNNKQGIICRNQTGNQSANVSFTSNTDPLRKFSIRESNSRRLSIIDEGIDGSDVNTLMYLKKDISNNVKLGFPLPFPGTGNGNYLRIFNNRIYKDTSLKESKSDITDFNAPVEEFIKTLPPLKSYYYVRHNLNEPTNSKMQYGFIAEDMIKQNPEFCTFDYNEDENQFKLSGINKDALLYFCAKWIQSQLLK